MDEFRKIDHHKIFYLVYLIVSGSENGVVALHLISVGAPIQGELGCPGKRLHLLVYASKGMSRRSRVVASSRVLRCQINHHFRKMILQTSIKCQFGELRKDWLKNRQNQTL